MGTLNRLGFGGDFEDICHSLLAILALGNVAFEANAAGEGPCSCVEADAAARLLGVPSDGLTEALIHRLVASGRGSMYRVALTTSQCADTRDALAKEIYKRFFDWAVYGLNERMATIDSQPTGVPPVLSSRKSALLGQAAAAASIPSSVPSAASASTPPASPKASRAAPRSSTGRAP